jgi:hypothetical protein
VRVLHKPALCGKLDVVTIGVRERNFDAFALFVKDAQKMRQES